MIMVKSLFTLKGQVEHHLGRGKTLGYPTANIAVTPSTSEGIYLGWTVVDGKRYSSLVFIGAAITFGETDKKAEVYLLDFRQNLYDKNIEVSIIKRLRDNIKFPSAKALVKQMKKDEQQARAFFTNYQGR